MREGWKSTRLGEVSEMIKRGIAPKYIDAGGVCVINQKCIRGHSINYGLARRHNIDVKKVPQERFIQLGDVLVNSTGTGTLGRVAQVRREPEEPATVDTHVTIVRPAHGVFYHDFFGYMLIKIEDELVKGGEGASGQTELARSKLENQFIVSFPKSIAEQKRIVAILDEAFAGIDSVVANAEKNLVNVRELFESYLNAAFYEKSKKSQVKTINELAKVVSGYSFKSGDFTSTNSVKPIKIANVGVREFVSESGNNLPREFSVIYSKFEVPQGSIVIALTRSIISSGLKVAIVPPSYDGALLNQRVAALKFDDDEILRDYVYFFLCTKSVVEYVMAMANTLMQPNLSINDLKKLTVPYPPENERQKIVENLLSLHAEVDRLEIIYQQKLTALAELKQSLLQKAFSGELTAERAEVAVEEATA